MQYENNTRPVANVITEDCDAEQKATVGRILKHKKGYYIVEMLSGYYKLFDSYREACARVRSLQNTYSVCRLRNVK